MDYSVLAKTAYMRNKQDRQNFANKYFGDRYQLLDQYSDKENTVYYDQKDKKLIQAVRGTDFKNDQGGKVSDLASDVLLSFGLETLTPRYKRSEKLLKRLQADYPGMKVDLTGHSLGSTLASDLAMKYDLESHGFTPGFTYSGQIKKHKTIHPETAKKREKNHIYIVQPNESQFDPISISSALSPFHTVHMVKEKALPKKDRGLLQHHDLQHFFPETSEKEIA